MTSALSVVVFGAGGGRCQKYAAVIATEYAASCRQVWLKETNDVRGGCGNGSGVFTKAIRIIQ